MTFTSPYRTIIVEPIELPEAPLPEEAPEPAETPVPSEPAEPGPAREPAPVEVSGGAGR